ncbi:MAG: nucleotidyltransferase domain-containing protein [Bacillota bacterium]
MRQEHLSSICEAGGISLAYLFGSQATAGAAFLRGDVTALSDDPMTDLDVGVVMRTPLPAAGTRHLLYSSLQGALGDCFPPFRVDLVLLQETHSVFQFEAIKGICVYQSSAKKRDQYEMMVLRRAADFRPVLDIFLREVLEEVAT